MKKLSLVLIVFFLLPFWASAAVYTCSVNGLGTLDVADPFGRDAQAVSTFTSRCTTAQGSVSGPAQTFSPANTGSTQSSGFCNGIRCNYIPLERLPGQDVPSTGVDFPSYLAAAFRVMIVLGGMFAVATFVFGGVTYMTSEVLQGKDFGRKQMQRAVYGILILLGSFLLLGTLNPDLLKLDNFNPNKILPGGATPQTASQTTLPRGATQQDLDDCYPKRLRNTASGGLECI